MRSHWLVKHERAPTLTLFFAGWSMDPRPFSDVDAGAADVLMFFDYAQRDLPEDMGRLLPQYEAVDLVAWSLGVAVSNIVCRSFASRLRAVLAVNGVIEPVHDQRGIPAGLFQATVDNLARGGVRRFVRRMCLYEDTLAKYDELCPQRGSADIAAELVELQRMQPHTQRPTIFTRAVVGLDDKIIRPRNQIRCWEHFQVPVTTKRVPHFPFYCWPLWQESLHCADD